jgi:hypothetical protein
MPLEALVTYDGLPVSSGGGHSLRTRSAGNAFSQVMQFFASCTEPSQPVRFSVESITGDDIPTGFSAPLLRELTQRYGAATVRSLGGDRSHSWVVGEGDVASLLSMIESLSPLPVHPYKLQPISLNALSFFKLTSPNGGAPYPFQEAACCLNFQPGFGQQLGVSQAYARISERSTLSLFLNFPFPIDSDELTLAVDAVQESLPFQLSKAHWKQWTLTKRGDKYLGRKVSPPGQSANSSLKRTNQSLRD